MEPFVRLYRAWTAYLTPAVRVLLSINVIVFLIIQATLFVLPYDDIVFQVIFTYLAQNAFLRVPLLFFWQFITSLFIHVGMLHLMLNMGLLIAFGPELEERWGTSRFWRIYLFSGIVTGLIHSVASVVIFDSPPPIYGAGAPMYALLLAHMAYYPNRPTSVFLWIPILMKYWIALLMLIYGVILIYIDPYYSHAAQIVGLAAAYFYLGLYHRVWSARQWRYYR